jgi:hypothetical protein
MTLDKNYSTINKQTKVYSIEESDINSRLITKINNGLYENGITGGDVIMFDTTANLYIKSLANSPSNAEVFGIVESVDADFALNVVTNGSISIPSSQLVNITGTNSGGNDIYFLSGTSAGVLQNCGPTFPDMIIKPLYHIAPHGLYTGLVRNYLGYKNNILSSSQASSTTNEFVPIDFSHNTTKAILYNPSTEEFLIVNTTFSLANLKFTTELVTRTFKRDIFIPPHLDNITFGIGVNFDAKISDNGSAILLFAKHINKIYFIVSDDSSNLSLEQIIDLDLVGSPEDKLWAADNELSSMTVSTKSLTRPATGFDSKITSHEVSSRIQYFKRTMNSIYPEHRRWKKIHENHAFGYCDSMPREHHGGAPVDSLSVTSGVYRTSDIKCKNKNYALSTFCLIQDQKNYKSKITGFHSPRYTGITKDTSFNYFDQIIGVTLSTVFSRPMFGTTKFFGNGAFADNVLANNASRDTPDFRSYKCGFGFKNYRIHTKSSNYFFEDFSYRDVSGIEYFEAAENGGIFTEFPSYDRRNDNPVTSASILDAPETSIEASITKTCCTENNIFCCFRYGTEIGVFKFPFMSNDGLTPFRYFERNRSGSTIPSTTGFGLIFQDTNSSIVDFNFFASDSVFFICTSNKTFINGTTEILTQNFNKAKFYTTATQHFFKVNNKIFRFNSATTTFEEILLEI